MEVVPEEICLGDSVVAVVHCEEGDLSLLCAAFGEIGDDADAVLIVGEKWAGVRVGRVPPDYAVRLRGYFGLVDQQRLNRALRFQLLLHISQLQLEGGGVREVELGS